MRSKITVFTKCSFLFLGITFFIAASTTASTLFDPTNQSEALIYNEAQTVYLGNLARQNEAGVPPLRWNRQLTDAARWFSRDSVENRAGPYCGHQDSTGGWPDDRALAFGYLGSAGAENAFCGYVTPQQAITGWLNSAGHRSNLLSPGHREIGLGYYQRQSDGRGYVAQGFGHDAIYPPVIIENEAIATINANVNLYIYDRSTSGGFAGLAPATDMMISNDHCFTDATWEPYTAQKSWTLANGDGWKSVFVKTRDNFGRTISVADSIYLGANVPLNEIGPEQMSSTEATVTLYGLDAVSWPRAQFSLGWLADDSTNSFAKWWGNGAPVNDAAAWGGTAYRLYPGNGESFAWVYDTSFIKNTPLVAYFRLKVNDNSSPNEVGRISVNGGGTEYGPVSLKGTDFSATNQYQEFAIPFTFHESSDVFLKFQFWRSGTADLYVDAVSIFSSPQAFTSPQTWNVPGNNYRGQGVWVRYSNETGTQFSSLAEVKTTEGALTVTPMNQMIFAVRDGNLPNPIQLTVHEECGDVTWQVSDDVPWLETTVDGQSILAQINQAGLSNGIYTGTVMITAVDPSNIEPLSVPIQLLIVDHIYNIYLPLTEK